MRFSSRIVKVRDLAALMVVFVSTTCCAASGDSVAAAPALTVYNNLKSDALTVLSLPGCCSPCGPHPPKGTACPDVCVVCSGVIVGARGAAELDWHVGPYPLPNLAVQVKDKVWCMDVSALKIITPLVSLVFGPGGCGPLNGGLQALVRRNGKKPVDVPSCLFRC